MSNQNIDSLEDTSLNTEFINDRDFNSEYQGSSLVPSRATDEGVAKDRSVNPLEFEDDSFYDDGPNYASLEEEEFDGVEFEGTCEGCGCGSCV